MYVVEFLIDETVALFNVIVPLFVIVALLKSIFVPVFAVIVFPDGILILYDVTNRQSFEQVKLWIESLEEALGNHKTGKYLICRKTFFS